MRKRTKFLVIVIAAILVLTVGLTTTAFAWGSSGEQDGGDKVLTAESLQCVVTGEGDEGEGPMQTFISKVASILELEEEQVADAFKQACWEMCDEALEQRLQKAVESGRLTEEQAGQIMEWWQDRPDVLREFGFCERFQPRNAWRHHRLQRPGPQQLPPGKPLLARIFDERLNGTITSLSEETNTIILEVEEDSEVSFQYTSNTVFVLRGVTAVEEGQVVIAWCWEDADDNLTAKLVRVRLP